MGADIAPADPWLRRSAIPSRCNIDCCTGTEYCIIHSKPMKKSTLFDFHRTGWPSFMLYIPIIVSE